MEIILQLFLMALLLIALLVMFVIRHYNLATAMIRDNKGVLRPDLDKQALSVFMTVQSGNIAFLVSNGTWKKTIVNVPGWGLDDEGNIVKGGRNSKPLFSGIYWKGFPSLVQKHRWTLPIEREKTNIKKDTPLSEYIEYEIEEREVNELRWEFPRPVYIHEADIKGNLTINALEIVNFRTVNPVRAVFIKGAKFFPLATGYIRSAFNDFVKDLNQDEYRRIDKTTLSGPFSDFMTRTLNHQMVMELGIELTGTLVRDSESSDAANQKIAVLQETTQKEGEAKMLKAELEGNALVTTAKRQAEANEILAVSQVADLQATMDLFRRSDVDPNIAAQEAARIIAMARAASKDSNISTLVQGGGANVAVPLKGDGK